MQTEFSLQIQPSTKIAASDQDPFKTMLQKMNNRNLASSNIFPDKFKYFGKLFFQSRSANSFFLQTFAPCPPKLLGEGGSPSPLPKRALALCRSTLAERDASLRFPAKHMPIGHMRARDREANEPSLHNAIEYVWRIG